MSDIKVSDCPNRALDDEIASKALTFTGAARWYIGLATTAAILLAIKQLFNLRVGAPMLEGMYLYVLSGLFLSITFLAFRITGRRTAQVPWYDWLLAFAAFGLGVILR